MAVTVQGLTLYRPTASVQREYSYDSDGETIGVTDNVTIHDTVLSEDADLVQTADQIIAYVKEGSNNFRSLVYGANTAQGRVASISFDSSSDYTNVLKYSITFMPMNFFIHFFIFRTKLILKIVYLVTLEKPNRCSKVE